MKRIARSAAALLLACAFMGFSAQQASAHAILDHSYPADGSTVSSSPPQIRLFFSEGVRLSFSTFLLSDTNGNTYHVTATAPGDSSQILLTGYPDLGKGVYIVSWHILSASDSHLTDGQILFGVGEVVTPSEAAASAPTERISSTEVALRWADILLSALVIGGLVIAAFVLRGAAGSKDIRGRVLTTVAWAGVASLGAGVVLFVWEATKVHGSLPAGSSLWGVVRPLLTEGRYAALWWTRQVALVGLILVGFTLRRSGVSSDDRDARGQAAVWWISGALIVVLALTRALGSHAASAQYSNWAVFVDTLHILAASIWMGGLLVLMIGTWPVLRHSDRSPLAALAVWRQFGLLAVISFGVLAATGLFEAARQVASLDALLFTPYGKALVAKTGLAVLLAVLGAANAMLLHPGIRARVEGSLRIGKGWTRGPRLPRWVVFEAAAGIVALLMVGIMTSSSPPRGPAFLAGSGSALPTAFQQVGDLSVTITITPNLPGSNQIKAQMVSTVRPAPAPVKTVTLTLTPSTGGQASTVQMKEISEGQFLAGGDQLDRPGSWQLVFTATRPATSTLPAEPDANATFDVVVGTGSSARKPIVSLSPIGRALTLGGILALLALFGGLMFIWFRSRRRGPKDAPPVSSGPVNGPDRTSAESDELPQPALVGRTREREGP